MGDLTAHLVERYGNEEVRTWGFEIWNEPNFRLYWGGDPDPESYARMIQAVAPAIKAALIELKEH